MRHRRERELLPVGRFRRVLDQASFNRTLVHLLREIKLWSKFLRNLRRKRNDGLRAGHHVQAANFAILVVNNFLGAGKKRISGKNVARETRLLIVACNRVTHPLVFAGLEVAHAQTGFGFKTRNVKHVFPVR